MTPSPEDIGDDTIDGGEEADTIDGGAAWTRWLAAGMATASSLPISADGSQTPSPPLTVGRAATCCDIADLLTGFVSGVSDSMISWSATWPAATPPSRWDAHGATNGASFTESAC
jgi:hypothetical protein